MKQTTGSQELSMNEGNGSDKEKQQSPPTKNGSPTKCKLNASLGACTPHRQMNKNHQVQPGSQADPVMHHPAHHRAQGKDASSASRGATQKGHSMHSKEATLPHKKQNHQHPCQPSKNDRAKPSCCYPRANATATPHILPYIGRDTVKTTNPEHTPPTRNHPADKQTPPQYKPEKPDATAEPSDALPAAPTFGGQSRHAQHAITRRTERSKEHRKQKPLRFLMCI
ncbi:hypothetical protein CRENBAI_019818 [Crenichthys baileyi]|uniref:Uncharacterized protein n=1 Tax=Crenichthys baileyi TaxID=28760 RepID=A0AAV9RWY0_9TELE